MNNFKICNIIEFLKTIKRKPDLCLQTINYMTGIHFSTLMLLRDSLLRCGYIRKEEANGRRANLTITEEGKEMLRRLKEIRGKA